VPTPVSAILTYHSLDTSGSVVSVTPDQFRRHIDILVQNRTPVVPLAEVQFRPGAVALTFDDAFQNFLPNALPLLTAHRMPATIFAVSGYVGRRNNWPSQPRNGIPQLKLMSWRDLTECAAAGLDIGAHTVTHPDLRTLPAAQVEAELDDCWRTIEDRLGRPVKAFAYPYGASNQPVRERAAQRFHWACGTDLQYLNHTHPACDLPRIDAYYVREPVWFERLFTAAGRGYLGVRALMRRARSAVAG
jgi:peptidoglycan/xylan/chitin deacetylase (PgdA/CDA1 family)